MSTNTFDGNTVVPARDNNRLLSQLTRVRELMQDGLWRTLAEIAARTGDPEASVSARLRDLRKLRFGGWIVERRYVCRGQYEYRIFIF